MQPRSLYFELLQHAGLSLEDTAALFEVSPATLRRWNIEGPPRSEKLAIVFLTAIRGGWLDRFDATTVEGWEAFEKACWDAAIHPPRQAFKFISPIGAPGGFRAYVFSRKQTQVSKTAWDFIEDAKSDDRLIDARTWSELEHHILDEGGCDAAVTAGRKVWNSYLAHLRRRASGAERSAEGSDLC